MRYEFKKIVTLLIQHEIPYRRLHLVALIVFCVVGVVDAEDWPTYMHDNARSGVTMRIGFTSHLHRLRLPGTGVRRGIPIDPVVRPSVILLRSETLTLYLL
jgi:hypothetical protein